MGIWINYLLIQSILEIWLWWVSAAMLCWPLRWRAIAGGREIYNGKYNDYHSTALWLDWGLPESLQTAELRWGRAIRTFVLSYHSRPCQTQWHSPQSEKKRLHSYYLRWEGKKKIGWHQFVNLSRLVTSHAFAPWPHSNETQQKMIDIDGAE